MTEYIYHLTGEQLRDLMTLAIAKWEALDRDVTAAVEAALAEDDAKRFENSLPLVDEDDWWLDDSQATEHLRLVEIPLNSSAPATVDDDPAIPDSWYTISTGEFIATVDRETNEIDYEDVK